MWDSTVQETKHGFVVRAHLPFSHLRIKQLHLEGIARNTINDNDGNNSYILNTYYLLTMLSAEKCYVIQFQNNYKKAENCPPSFIQRNVTSEAGTHNSSLLQQEEKLVQRVKEKAKVRRGLKAEKTDTFQRGLCHIHAKSIEMIILPLSRDYGSICLEFC